MSRDDGDRIGKIRRTHKVKVKRRDKVGKVSDAAHSAGCDRGKQKARWRAGGTDSR